MTNDSNPLDPPSMLVSLLAAGFRHALTAVGGILVADGLLEAKGMTELVTVGVGLAPIVASVLWSFYQKRNAGKTIATLRNKVAAQ